MTEKNTPPSTLRKANARGAARLACVQALYQMDIAGTDVHELIEEYISHRLGREIEGNQYIAADADFFRSVVDGVVKEQRLLDIRIHEALAKGRWPLARLDATVRAILRAASYELYFRSDVPARVVISEYVDVAKAFFDNGDEPKIINGVLDTLAHSVRVEELKPAESAS